MSGKRERKRCPPPPGHGRAPCGMLVRLAGRSPCLGIKDLLQHMVNPRCLLGMQVEASMGREGDTPTSRPCFCVWAYPLGGCDREGRRFVL